MLLTNLAGGFAVLCKTFRSIQGLDDATRSAYWK